jgi:hypothetical protein
MRVFTPAELRRFLTAADRALEHRAEVVIIGGAAAALGYGVATGTRDVDTWSRVQEGLAAAVERARRATGLAVPFSRSPVADGPQDFESRLQRTLPRLRLLRVMVPERHDLVLMKVVRCDEHDLQAIEAIHQRSPLQLPLLLTRYREEMGPAIVDPRRLRGQFLTMVERLFPESVDGVERVLRPSKR